MPRVIIHLDLDAFFCAVEELHNSDLRGKAFAVGGKPNERGVVSSCSYPARSRGVRSAMPMARAIRICPNLIVVPPHYHLYSAVSRQVMEELASISKLVEQISIDEAFIDVSDVSDTKETVARELQDNINTKYKLPCSLGVASNKLVAKIANDFGKLSANTDNPPNAITIVPDGEEEIFLRPLPVQMLWGVGPKSAQRLSKIGISTIGDLAQMTTGEMSAMFGKIGAEIVIRARGIDDRPIVTYHEPKSISQEVTFAKDISDEEQLKYTLIGLSQKVSVRLRKSERVGTTIKIKVRWSNFVTITRQVTIKTPTDQPDDIFNHAWKLVKSVWGPGKMVRLIGIGVSGLIIRFHQLNLWEDDNRLNQLDSRIERKKRLQSTIDEIHHRFGSQVLWTGKTFKSRDQDQLTED